MSELFSELDRRMMQRALELALHGRFTNHPNPRVGCVITQGEHIVGEGWHHKWGEAHAEVRALQAAGAAAKDSTVYVTLEPHSYQGRTPPCTTALIRAGVKRVVCGALDPNPKVHGEGVRQLQAAGLDVQSGLLEAAAREINLGFEKRMLHGVPRVIVKIAASLDGRVALANGESRWLTGPEARADVHVMRAEASAVLTGINTVIADDPQLTVRNANIDLSGRQPLRVVLDTRLRMNANARMLSEPGETIVYTDVARTADASALQEAGATIVGVPVAARGVDIRAVLQDLGHRQCNDVLVEAGPTLSGQLIEAGVVDELIVYIAPKLLGADARPMLQLPRLAHLTDALQFTITESLLIGADMKIRYRPHNSAA
jgi:diaminohydroxyphosphoribosylaminopyrimidine deaminase/5-amino-6-(5-phosphoribosylamino)uracil reductase